MKQTRRTFLKTGMAAGAATTLLPFIPRIVYGEAPPADAPPARHTIILPGGGRRVDVPGMPTDFLVEKNLTAGRVSIIQHIVAPGVLGAPPHRHKNEDEFAFVLEGELSLKLGDEVVRAMPGTLIIQPRGQIHTFWNQRPAPLRFLEILSPAGFEACYEDRANMKFSSEDPPQSEIDAAFAELGRKYNVEFFMIEWQKLMLDYSLTPG